MSIVKMKRLRVIGFEEERDELLQKLLHLGASRSRNRKTS